MIDFEKLWLDGVNDRFERMSSDIILNDNQKNARHLLRKLLQVGLTELGTEPDGRRVFRLATTQLCHDRKRSPDLDVYDYEPLVSDAKRFIESGGHIRVVCMRKPEPSEFLTLLENFAANEPDRVQVRVCSDAEAGDATFSWRDFSVCGNSYRFEIPDDEVSKKGETQTARAIACANDKKGVIEQLKELFELQWSMSESYAGR